MSTQPIGQQEHNGNKRQKHNSVGLLLRQRSCFQMQLIMYIRVKKQQHGVYMHSTLYQSIYRHCHKNFV